MKNKQIGVLQFKKLDGNGDFPDFICTNINNTAETILGIKKENWVNKKVSGLMHTYNWMMLRARFSMVQSQNTPTEIIAKFLGAENYTLVKIVPFDTEDIFVFVSKITKDYYEEILTHDEEQMVKSLETIFNSPLNLVSLLKYENNEFTFVKNNAMHQSFTKFNNVENVNLKELVSQPDFEEYEVSFLKALQNGCIVTREDVYERDYGSVIMESEISPIYARNGKVYVLKISRDVSKHKIIEKEFDEMSNFLFSMFHEHRAMMLLLDDKTGQVIDVNPSACLFYGYTKEEFLTLNISDYNVNAIRDPKEHGGKLSHVPHRLKSGEIRYVDIYSETLIRNGKKVRFVIEFDVTRERNLYTKAAHNELFLQTTLNSMNEGVITIGLGGFIVDANKRSSEILGHDKHFIINKFFPSFIKIYDEKTGDHIPLSLEYFNRSGNNIKLNQDAYIKNKDGKIIPISGNFEPIISNENEVLGTILVFKDITREKEIQDKILFMSYHDELTGLYNRNYTYKKIVELNHSTNYPIAVIIGNMNGLKLANDIYGHRVGDRLLIEVAEVIKDVTKDYRNLSVRWGGDEYVILLKNATEKITDEVIHKVRSKVEKIVVENTALSPTIAMDYSMMKDNQCQFEQHLKIAEEKMYRKKYIEDKLIKDKYIGQMLNSLYDKSEETEQHSRRLEKLSFEIGQRLNLPTYDLHLLSNLALLHDIGKEAIDSKILMKKGKLTDDEWEEMKKHPEIGYRISRSIPELIPVSDLILSHHERWDGAGYPRGLKGEEIPLLCRILSIADTFDAMTHDRSYRDALSIETAKKEILNNSGKQFDPVLVEIFLDLPNEVLKKAIAH